MERESANLPAWLVRRIVRALAAQPHEGICSLLKRSRVTKTLARDLVGIDRMVANIRTGHFERTLSALAAAGAAITTGEIYLSHDSASFGNKMMWVPIVVMPTVVPAGIAGVFSKRAAKTVLPLASAVVVANGLQGTYLHWRGIAQKPGGLQRSMRLYNAEMGPPMFAPLLASLVGGMGILAAILRREGE